MQQPTRDKQIVWDIGALKISKDAASLLCSEVRLSSHPSGSVADRGAGEIPQPCRHGAFLQR
jgi:hypothetical protein